MLIKPFPGCAVHHPSGASLLIQSRPPARDVSITSETTFTPVSPPGWLARLQGSGIVLSGSVMTAAQLQAKHGVSEVPDLRSRQRRPYQQELIDVCVHHVERGGDRGLIVLPTGTGKTFAFTEVLWELRQRGLLHGKKSLVVAHQDQIVLQNARELSRRFSVGIYQGDRRELDPAAVVATPQTLCLNAASFPWEEFDLLVLDEAHHYVPSNQWFEIARRMGFFDAQNQPLSQSGGRLLLGFTATPDRLDGEPLVTVYGPNLLYARDINYFIGHHWLLEPHGVEVTLAGQDAHGRELSPREVWEQMTLEEKGALLADILTSPHVHEGARMLKTVVFLNSREEVLGLEGILNDHYEVGAVGILEDTPDRDRKLAALKEGRKPALLNINIAGEGFDDPGLEVAVLIQDCQSRARIVQQCGRVLRIDPRRPSQGRGYLYDLMGVLKRHQIQVAAEEAYTWGGSRLLPREPSPRGDRSKGEPGELVTCHWNFGEYGQLVVEDQRFFEVLHELLVDEEGAMRASYLAGLSSDEALSWYLEKKLPGSEQEVVRLALALQDPGQRLLVAYQESVGAAIKGFLIRRLQERAQELGRSPTGDEMGGDYPAKGTYLKYFGSWNQALTLAELTVNQVTGTIQDQAIKILRQAQQELGGTPLTQRAYDNLRNSHPDWPSSKALCRAITGSPNKWNQALTLAELTVNQVTGTTQDQAIKILQQAQQELGGTPLTRQAYDNLRNSHPGWPSCKALCWAITGSPDKWNQALKLAGLTVNQEQVRGTTQDQTIKILRQAQQELGGTPLTQRAYNNLRNRHPDWPSYQALCRAITGSPSKWNQVLQAARDKGGEI